MKLKENLFESSNMDSVRCQEMHRCIVVSEKIKKALFEAGLKGLKFSDSVDLNPKKKSISERI